MDINMDTSMGINMVTDMDIHIIMVMAMVMGLTNNFLFKKQIIFKSSFNF